MKSFHTKFSLIIFFFLSLFFHIVPFSADAQLVTFEENFDMGLEQWELVQGYWDNWELIENELLIEATVDVRGRVTQLVPKDAFWDDSFTAYEFELEYTPIAGADRNIGFGYIDSESFAELHFVQSFTELAVYRNGRHEFRALSNFVLENGKKYHILIRVTEGNIQVYIDGEELFNEDFDQDLSLLHGKLALRAGTGYIAPTIARFDSIIFRDLNRVPETILPMTSFKQSDSTWKDDEYDSATQWSKKPGIGRWGCALSSMAMVMDHYGISTFSFAESDQTTSNESLSGKPVTPQTLNFWLKSQPDGYVGQGALNWMAVTRLVAQISESSADGGDSIPKLEYGYRSGSGGELSNQMLIPAREIFNQRPVILEIDGHFLVGNGIKGAFDLESNSAEDLYITDPAYTYDHFSQHHENIVSTRTFQPSFTDLSYILVVVPETVSVQIQDENGNELDSVVRSTEQIEAIDWIENIGELTPEKSADYSPSTVFYQFSKPEDGEYSVMLSSNEQAPLATDDALNNMSDDDKFATLFSKIQIIAYDREANPTIFSELFHLDSDPQTVEISYVKTAESTILPKNTWSRLRNDFAIAYENGLVKKSYFYMHIDRYLAYADERANNSLVQNQNSDEKVSAKDQIRYQEYISNIIVENQDLFSENFFHYFNNKLNSFVDIL